MHFSSWLFISWYMHPRPRITSTCISIEFLPLLSVPIRWTGKRIGTLFSKHRLPIPRGGGRLYPLYQIFKPWIVLIWTLSENHSIRLNVAPSSNPTLSLDLIKSKIVEIPPPLLFPQVFLDTRRYWRDFFFFGWILIDHTMVVVGYLRGKFFGINCKR